MKLQFLSLLFIAFLLTVSCHKNKEKATVNASTEASTNALVKINVNYEKQPGPGSNQWAIWIEDSNEQLVKTVFVTAFTADGGYAPRPACTPIWVSKANPASLSGDLVDAFSGATPSSGLQTYLWNLTDNSDAPIVSGTYTVVVEATLFGDSEVIYKTPVTIGDKEVSATAEPYYTSRDEKNKGMIKSVSAEYAPVEYGTD
jgi:hypothetical protein